MDAHLSAFRFLSSVLNAKGPQWDSPQLSHTGPTEATPYVHSTPETDGTCVSRTWSWPRHRPQTENSGKMLSVIYHCFVSQDSDQTGESGNKKTTYLFWTWLLLPDPQRCPHTAGWRWRCTPCQAAGWRGCIPRCCWQAPPSPLYDLFPIIKTETIERCAYASKAQQCWASCTPVNGPQTRL